MNGKGPSPAGDPLSCKGPSPAEDPMQVAGPKPGAEVFGAYGRYYDLLYRDKDYAAEVDYLHRLLQRKRSDPLLAALALVAQATDSLAPSPLAGEGWGEGSERLRCNAITPPARNCWNSAPAPAATVACWRRAAIA